MHCLKSARRNAASLSAATGQACSFPSPDVYDRRGSVINKFAAYFRRLAEGLHAPLVTRAHGKHYSVFSIAVAEIACPDHVSLASAKRGSIRSKILREIRDTARDIFMESRENAMRYGNENERECKQKARRYRREYLPVATRDTQHNSASWIIDITKPLYITYEKEHKNTKTSLCMHLAERNY